MISVFDLFKIGLGPSSSHTMGPMLAAAAFAAALAENGQLPETQSVQVTLYGSLAWTGHGHATDRAILLGLSGCRPRTVDPDRADEIVAAIHESRKLTLAGRHSVDFNSTTDLRFDKITPAPRHPNTLALEARNAAGQTIAAERWCSVGGGFIVREAELDAPSPPQEAAIPHPFVSGTQLLRIGEAANASIAELMLANERALRPEAEIAAGLAEIDAAMMACIDRGLTRTGTLPGGLNVKRRAPALLERLRQRRHSNQRLPHEAMDWVSLYAIAVNEENAAGGRVVTAPTNGAAGVIPAVLRYWRENTTGDVEEGIRNFLLTATAIGALIKLNASISGAEVGCQGEVGAACAMAAAGLAAVLGGSNAQIENAAEIAMEHHLGMTCDPIGGLVQIPCIERNAFGAVKAINAASLALAGTGEHHVSLDRVIATMRATGADMQAKYKETAAGGLAVNFIEC